HYGRYLVRQREQNQSKSQQRADCRQNALSQNPPFLPGPPCAPPPRPLPGRRPQSQRPPRHRGLSHDDSALREASTSSIAALGCMARWTSCTTSSISNGFSTRPTFFAVKCPSSSLANLIAAVQTITGRFCVSRVIRIFCSSCQPCSSL